MSTPIPTEVVALEKEALLRVAFDDDVVIDFPTPFLRGFCPCARCQGHGGGPATYRAPATSAATRVENVTPVGAYAMCIVWGDGHDTGIYSFSLLRAMDTTGFDPASVAEGDEMPRLHDA